MYICVDTTIIALLRSIPIPWDGEPASLSDMGWDWALKTGMESAKAGQQANTLCALEIVLSPSHRGQGLSRLILNMMRDLALERGYSWLIAPVRPSYKHRYPLIPMDEYAAWQQADGLLFDPWLRTHQRLGARIVKIAPQSMRIEGTVREWELWTGMVFPGSGQHIVPLALVPVTIDREADLGIYLEPNVWMLHSISPAATAEKFSNQRVLE